MVEFPTPVRHRWSATVPMASLLLLALSATPAPGQTQPSPAERPHEQQGGHEGRPPDVVVIYQENLKAGRTAIHNQMEAKFAHTYARVPDSHNYLALTSVTGAPQAWFIEPHSDFASVEKAMAAYEGAPSEVRSALDQLSSQETDNLVSSRVVTVLYRDDLSFNPAHDMSKVRYMEVTTFEVRPGHGAEFEEAAKLVRATHEKGNVPGQWIVFQVYSGAPSGTFYLFELADSFTKVAPDMAREKAFGEALGAEGRQKLMRLVADGVVSIQTNLFALKPEMSYVPAGLAAANEFWSRAATAEPAAVATSGKDAKVIKK